VKRALLLLLLACLWVPTLRAQSSQRDSLIADGLARYFAHCQAEAPRTSNTFAAKSFEVDETQRTLHVIANTAFSTQLMTRETVERIYSEMPQYLPEPYNTYNLTVYSAQRESPIEDLVPNLYRTGNLDAARLWGDRDYQGAAWVRNVSQPYHASRGLNGRHLVVAPSHGRYFNGKGWRWQRPYLFCTTEDLFTQSIANPFLIPMLEHAGAVVYSPRERDIQVNEAVVDNDVPEAQDGTYAETTAGGQAWETCDAPGFAPAAESLDDDSRPFESGTARQIATISHANQFATATWTPNIPADGRYAVYVSYQTRPNSVSDAHYTVIHKGGQTEFLVNQQMGGSTWVYLGTFEFLSGENQSGRVVLSNESNEQGVVSADGVRFGGGRGQTRRGEAGTSGLPRFLEGARYQAQWCGMSDSIYNMHDSESDYNSDIRTRSNMTNFLAGGSVYLPSKMGRGVPFELSLALHSDAGIRRDNSVFGTLGICTSVDDSARKVLPSGLSRMASNDLAAITLQNVQRDLSAICPTWTNRGIWDKSYGESRTPQVPSIILESMSHQNFGDLKYGHDPNFKFALARSIYKAILQYVNFEHGVRDVVVQPLPPRCFAAILSDTGSSVRLSWQPTRDELEPTAAPAQYVLYTKMGDGAFDNGQIVSGTSITLPIHVGTQYAFRVSAVNDGGESFPSETLSVYKAKKERGNLLIVNGFRRVSGPARIETADSLGFDLKQDVGVPYLYTTAFAGYQRDFDPAKAGGEGEGALGYCGDELVGQIIAGNTFDYPLVHGAAIAASERYSFSSCSRDAAAELDWKAFRAVDLILGLERDASYNLKKYKTFDAELRAKIEGYTQQGGNVLVSGAYLAADLQTAEEQNFARNVLKFENGGTVSDDLGDITGLKLHFAVCRDFNPYIYALQCSDCLLPVGARAFSAFAYSGGLSAGVAYKGSDYRVVAMGFPFESIADAAVRADAMNAILRFLLK